MSVEVASLSREKEIYKVTIVGSIVNFVLLAFKFVAGILGHSAAMLADAVHSLSDFVEWCFFYLGFYERRTTGGTWNGGTDSCSYFYFAEGDIISIYSY